MVHFFFSGSALCACDEDGRLKLPPFVRATLARRGDTGSLTVGAHERSPCLVAYDRSIAPLIHAELERRRGADNASHAAHDARARLAFGLAEEAAIAPGGAIGLPRMMRHRARIGTEALVVGTGQAFEIWDAEVARDSDDPAIRELAAFHLDFQDAA